MPRPRLCWGVCSQPKKHVINSPWSFNCHSGSGTSLGPALYPREAMCWQAPSYLHRACWEGFQNKLDLLGLGHDMGTENLLHSPAVVMACFDCQDISPVYSALITSLLCADFLQRDWISPPAKEVTYVSAFCLHLERHRAVCTKVLRHFSTKQVLILLRWAASCSQTVF